MNEPQTTNLPSGANAESEAVRSSDLLGAVERTESSRPEAWLLVLVNGDDVTELPGELHAKATDLYVDVKKSGTIAIWGISGRCAYWSGVGGRPSLDEIATLIEKAKAPNVRTERETERVKTQPED